MFSFNKFKSYAHSLSVTPGLPIVAACPAGDGRRDQESRVLRWNPAGTAGLLPWDKYGTENEI